MISLGCAILNSEAMTDSPTIAPQLRGASHHWRVFAEASMRGTLLSVLVSLIFVSVSSPLLAQQVTGTIKGVVTDPSGATIANATVDITNKATGLTRTVTTNTEGEYSAPDLPFGVYRVSVKQASFKESVTDNVDLHVSSSAITNIVLQLGSATETVTVEANEIQVQTDNS